MQLGTLATSGSPYEVQLPMLYLGSYFTDRRQLNLCVSEYTCTVAFV